MKRLTHAILHAIKRKLQKLWITFLLLYSSLILFYQFLRTQPPLILFIPFLIFVPGYALNEALLPKLQKLEKIIFSLALSLALPLGLKSLMQTFKVEVFVSEITITTVLAVICFIAILVKDFTK